MRYVLSRGVTDTSDGRGRIESQPLVARRPSAVDIVVRPQSRERTLLKLAGRQEFDDEFERRPYSLVQTVGPFRQPNEVACRRTL